MNSEGDIPFYCNYLMSFEDDLTAIASFFLAFALGSSRCVDVTYKDTLSYYLDSTYVYGACKYYNNNNSNNILLFIIKWKKTEKKCFVSFLARPWYYQTCNEYGWYQSSASSDQPFGTKFPATLYTTLCYDIFGSKYTNEHIQNLVDETNEFFGGLNPGVENVYMTHGSLDPWSAMGHGVSEGATVIPRASHCADFGSIKNNDSAEMRASKERLAELVRQWLA